MLCSFVLSMTWRGNCWLYFVDMSQKICLNAYSSLFVLWCHTWWYLTDKWDTHWCSNMAMLWGWRMRRLLNSLQSLVNDVLGQLKLWIIINELSFVVEIAYFTVEIWVTLILRWLFYLIARSICHSLCVVVSTRSWDLFLFAKSFGKCLLIFGLMIVIFKFVWDFSPILDLQMVWWLISLCLLQASSSAVRILHSYV